MILQCDQCNTKFRLDDSKLKPGGVKVRCSKCRHVFLAGAEPRQEESDFDALLSGLGAPAPEKQPESAASEESAAAFSFSAESAAQQSAEPAAPAVPAAGAPAAEATAGMQVDFSEFDFPAEPAAQQVKETPLPEEKVDFGGFDFAAEPAAHPEKQAPAEEGPGFGDFELPAEPAAPHEKGKAEQEFGDIEFSTEPAAAPEKAKVEPEFGDFEFSLEPPPPVEAPSAASGQELDYGEFAFMEEPPAVKEEPAAAGGLDFGEFAFEEPAPETEKAAPASPASGLDFGEFEFNPEPAAEPVKAPTEPAATQELDFGAFAFSEEPAAKVEEPAPAAKEEFDLSDFSFEEEPPPVKEEPAAESGKEFGDFSFSEAAQEKKAEPVSVPEEEEFSLGDFSFSEEPVNAEPASEPVPPSPAAQTEEPFAASFAAAGATSKEQPAPAQKEAAAEPAEVAGEAEAAPGGSPVDARKPAGTSSLDFDFGAPSVFGAAADAGEEEELPPLSISSRRKGRSLFTVAVVTISLLVIVALTGAGLYLLQSGPAALAKFDKLGLGFVGKWFGMETPEEGHIVIRNPLASFYQNKEAGELFVVTGDAVNSYRKPRASIRVKVSLFDKKGAVLMQKTAYCGNRLSKEQLETLPMEKIESIMNNQFGDSLSNLGVKPGQSIGFVVAIPHVPKEAADFGVEVIGSTVAGQ